MAKIVINGETFDYDGMRKPMTEALEIERALGIRYAQYEEDLQAGSMRALAAFIWTVLHRDGRTITIDDILTGAYEVDVVPVLESLLAAAEEAQKAQEDPDPTVTAGDPDPAGTPGTGTGTRRSSRSTTT